LEEHRNHIKRASQYKSIFNPVSKPPNLGSS
jgi:hypothetical protein